MEMNFDLTRFGLIGAGNATNVHKTDFTKAKQTQETEEKTPVVQTKTADASALDAAAAQNVGLVRANAKQVEGENATDLANLYALAGIQYRMPTEREYARIAATTTKAMDDVVRVGTAANAEKSLAEFEKLFG